MDASILHFDEIKKGGYEASFITTFNAYLPLYEEVILRKLRSNGVRHNVLLMDANQCQRSFSSYPPSKAGRHYALLPMHSAGAFHPKIILLLGKKKGLLYIGSHNLTLSGFGTNRELTNVIRFDVKSPTSTAFIFRQILGQIKHWLNDQGDYLPRHFKELFEKIQGVSPWLEGNLPKQKDISIIATSADRPSLWNQLTSIISEPVKSVLVGGAFFDRHLAFLARLHDQFQQADIVVSIDPWTVKAPPELSTWNKGRIVSSASIGPRGKFSDNCKGYLHAKYLVIETVDGKTYLITGSANPSAPAWLANGKTGNTEIMIVRSDPDALSIAEGLELTELKTLEPLSEDDWEIIARNWAKDEAEITNAVPIGMAVLNECCVRFSTRNMIKAPFACLFIDEDNKTLVSYEFENSQQCFEIVLENEQLLRTSTIEVHNHQGCIEKFFIHNEILLEELSRTGEQRKLRDALSSLSFESPDLKTFLDCVERIIFTKANDINCENNGRKTIHGNAEDNAELTDFSIDVSETKKAKRNYRLQVKEDLSYLLDTLIYHLRVEDNDTNHFESVDGFGRSEEEQPGEEDSTDIATTTIQEDEKERLLSLCHKKVKLLVKRMVDNFKLFKKQELSIEELIVRLTGVLAVLRELRNCDDKQDWVPKNKTTVPKDQREKLLKAILENLYEGNQSLVQMHLREPEMAKTDHIMALKGLLIWLTWDCELQFITTKPMAESSSEECDRLLHNAYLLAIAQLVDGEGVINHAKKSVSLLSNSDSGWIDWITRFSHKINELKSECPVSVSRQILPGDIAVSNRTPQALARLVQSVPDGTKAQMFCFDSKRPPMQFTVDSIRHICPDDFMG